MRQCSSSSPTWRARSASSSASVSTAWKRRFCASRAGLMSDSHRAATSSHGRVRSAVAAAFSRRRNSGWTRVATRSTTAGGSLVLAASGRRSGRSRVYMKPSTKRAWRESAGTPTSAKARPNPAAMESSMSHWQIGVVPPGKWDRSRAQRPGPGGVKLVVLHQRPFVPAARRGSPADRRRRTAPRGAAAPRAGVLGVARRRRPDGGCRLRRPGRAARRARPDRFPPVPAPGRAGEAAGGARGRWRSARRAWPARPAPTTTSVTVEPPMPASTG